VYEEWLWYTIQLTCGHHLCSKAKRFTHMDVHLKMAKSNLL